MLVDEIKKAKLVAMKNKDADARAIYDIVVNKYMLLDIENKSKGKESSDADMVQVIMKTIKELADEKAEFEKLGRADNVKALAHQEEVLKVYLPKMLTEDEIKAEIAKLDDKSMPSIMKHFKTNFAGKVDMGVVSKIAKNI
jgi:uncharacterized protein YqeY